MFPKSFLASGVYATYYKNLSLKRQFNQNLIITAVNPHCFQETLVQKKLKISTLWLPKNCDADSLKDTQGKTQITRERTHIPFIRVRISNLHFFFIIPVTSNLFYSTTKIFLFTWKLHDILPLYSESLGLFLHEMHSSDRNFLFPY